MMLRVLDLFSGIGAYALGYSRAGWTPAAFCENNPKCRRVLRAQFAGVPVYDDVETLTGEQLRADGVDANWIVAGWPCQDISVAGSGLGLDGSRSGLWPHVPRLAREIRAEGLLLENSSNLLTLDGGRHFERVLGDLAALGLDAEWHCLPAAAFDAPHIRDRLWIVATPNASRQRRDARRTKSKRRSYRGDLAANANSYAPFGTAIARQERFSWPTEPDVVRVVHGAPARVDRIHGLGNCNPPIIPETIARAIIAAHESCLPSAIGTD